MSVSIYVRNMLPTDVKPHAHWTRDTTICEVTVQGISQIKAN